jgi:hypothetical protein
VATSCRLQEELQCISMAWCVVGVVRWQVTTVHQRLLMQDMQAQHILQTDTCHVRS